MHGDPEADQPRGVRGDVELPLKSTERVHLDDARYIAKLRLDHPILQFAQIGGRPRGAIGAERAGFRLHDVREDLAEAGGDGAHCRRETRREAVFDTGETLIDELARKVNVGPVREYDRDLGEAVAREGACVLHARQAAHGCLHREGHALLDFERGEAGCLDVDLHLDVRDVGHGVYRQPLVVAQAEQRDAEHRKQHEPAFADRELNNTVEHGVRNAQ